MGERIKWEGSALGYGAMRLPWKGFLFIKKVKPEEEEAIKIIRHAIDNGVNFIDTAYGYMGRKSENIVGKALKDGYRENIYLQTKCPMWKVKKTEDVLKLLDEQLERLQEDYLDIYLFHGLNKKRFENQIKKLNLIPEMEKAKKAGKIKHIGFSFHDNFEAFKEIVDFYDWDVCLVQMNIMDTNNQATIEGLKYAADKGIAVNIMEPLRGGKLANPSDEIIKIFDGAKDKRTPVDWALQFMWNKPYVSTVFSGMGSMQMVKENLASADKSGINSLSDDDNQMLEKVAELYRKLTIIPCTKCNYCLDGCIQGVNIPQVFDILNGFSNDKNLKKAKKKYKKLIKDATKVNKDNKQGGPEVCTKCNSCLELCPQEIDIPDILEKVKRVIDGEEKLQDVFKYSLIIKNLDFLV